MPLRLVRNRVRLPVLCTALVVCDRVEVMTVPVRARVSLKCCLDLCTNVEVCLSRIGTTPPNRLSRLANLLWLMCMSLGKNSTGPVLLNVDLSPLTTLHMAANLLWSKLPELLSGVPGPNAPCKLGRLDTETNGPIGLVVCVAVRVPRLDRVV